jgi:sugar O-acyltransferase (sialic acid O-acetyltransferase NeuD family)
VTRVLLIGAGGHAQVVADIVLEMARAGARVSAIGFLDDAPDLRGRCLLGLPVLGTISAIRHVPHDAVVVAIGDNRTRSKITLNLSAQGETFLSAVHPRAVLGSDVRVGLGTMICAGVVVNVAARIGDGVILNTGCTVDHHCTVGSYCHIAPGAHLGGDVLVEEGAFVGIGSSVIPGRRIGRWAILGGGAAVVRDVPDGEKVVGVPARPISR